MWLDMGPLDLYKSVHSCQKYAISESTPVAMCWKASTRLKNYNAKLWACDYACI